MFRPLDNPRKAEQVVQRVLVEITEGRLEPGQRLPDENTMAQEFEVSRNCVREALRILETMSVVEVRHGRGCFLVDKGEAVGPARNWLYWLSAFKAEVLDLLEAREAVEAKAAQLAAVNAGEEDLAELDKLADEMVERAKGGSVDVTEFIRIDQSFHAAVARASGNSFVVQLAPGTWGASDRQATFLIEGRALLSARQHQEIVAAISARDAEAARKAMVRHIRDVIDQVKAYNRESEETKPEE